MRVTTRVKHTGSVAALVIYVLSSGASAAVAQNEIASCQTRWEASGGEVAGPAREWRRAAEVAGRTPLAAISRRESSPDARFAVCADSIPAVLAPWLDDGATTNRPLFALLPLRNLTIYNSAFPDDRNTGVLWAGRGLSSSLTFGARASIGPLTVQLAPTVAWQSNDDVRLFDTTTVGIYSGLTQHIRRIDLPQRFGTESFSTIHPGQSVIRLDVAGIAGGVSTENLWWGPGQRNSIILSNAAGGFPHAFLGAGRPLRTPIGSFRFEAAWGQLDESEYFDTIPSNDHRLFSGLTVTYEPSFLPGLQIGGNRVFTFMPDSVSTRDFIFRLFQPAFKADLATTENPSGSDPDDQIGSIFARWVLQPSQFEVYAEWSKSDHNVDWWDLLNEPDHAQGYALGFQKIVTKPNYWVRITGELTHLNASTTFRSGRGGGVVVTYYTHSRMRQGYTNEGQILGAWIGPGSNTQYLSADVVRRNYSVGGYMERIAHDVDAYYNRFATTYRREGHDSEFGVGARGLFNLWNIGVSWRGGWNIRRNRSFIGLIPTNFDFLVENNWSLEINAIAHVDQLLRK
jgi:hypothetical protein